MSYFDDASLAFLPSGGAGKDGKAYSIKPTDGTGDFTFSRGSNLAATRVGADGLIEKGRENLLLRSNDFDTTWNNDLGTGSSIQNGQTGYDGTTDAWLITKTKSVGRITQGSLSFGGVSTFSVYAKRGDSDYIVLQAASNFAYFDLTTGLAQNETSGIISATSTNEGNGWYRCSIVFNVSASSACYVYPAEDGSVSATTGSIYIQDSQAEIGLAATDYIESGASTGKAGLLEDEPRFDYSGGATCPSLLLEPSRTNLIGYSEYAKGSGWVTISSGTILDNVDTSPEGVINAFSFETTAFGALRHNVTLATSTTYTFSFYAKNVDASNARYRVFINSSAIDLVPQTSYFSQLSTTEWKRIDLTFTTDATNTSYSVYVSSGNQNGTILFYGAQVEVGSYPTSYIPNHSGGTITRGADIATILNQSGVIGQTEGTIFFDAYFDESDKVNFSISDSTSSNFIAIDTTGANSVFARVTQGGVSQAEINTSGSYFTAGQRLKCAIAYKANDFAFYINGTQIGTDSSGSVPACDDIRFARYNGSLAAAQRVNKTLLFDTRLSNADLETLTT